MFNLGRFGFERVLIIVGSIYCFYIAFAMQNDSDTILELVLTTGFFVLFIFNRVKRDYKESCHLDEQDRLNKKYLKATFIRVGYQLSLCLAIIFIWGGYEAIQSSKGTFFHFWYLAVASGVLYSVTRLYETKSQ